MVNYGDLMESLRGTGRTTRMLREAIKIAETGRTVRVIAAHAEHRGQMQSALHDLQPDLHPDVRNHIVFLLGDALPHPIEYMLRLKMVGVKILVDHYTAECASVFLIREMHAYDLEY